MEKDYPPAARSASTACLSFFRRRNASQAYSAIASQIRTKDIRRTVVIGSPYIFHPMKN